jgi:GTP cyclohydrolase II
MGKKRRSAQIVNFRQRQALLTTRTLPESLRTSPDAIRQFVDFARNAMRPLGRSVTVKEHGQTRRYAVTRRGYGITEKNEERFWFYDFAVNDEWRDYEVLVRAPIDQTTIAPFFEPSRPIFLRIDSGCATGQVFHDPSCECREQLHKAIELLVASSQGLIIRIPRQDGRGMGLPFKLSTLTLQYLFGTKIFDTVEAALRISDDGRIERRTYGGAIAIMKFLGISRRQRVTLATQNNLKANALLENGFKVEHASIRIPETKKTRHNLNAKRARLGHRE